MDLDVLRFCGERQALLVLLGRFNQEECRVYRSSSFDILRVIQLGSPLLALDFLPSHLFIPPVSPPFLTSTSSPSHVPTMPQTISSPRSRITCNITLQFASHLLCLFHMHGLLFHMHGLLFHMHGLLFHMHGLLFYQFRISLRISLSLKLNRRNWWLGAGLFGDFLDERDERKGGCGGYILVGKQFDLKFILWLEREHCRQNIFTCWFPSRRIHASLFGQFLNAFFNLLVTTLESIRQIPYCSSNCVPNCTRPCPNGTHDRGEHISQELKLAGRHREEHSQHQH